MDGEKVSSINQLRTRFPALSFSEARALLEKHNGNVIIAGAEAEQMEKRRATSGGGGENYFVGGGDKGSGQQVMAAPGEGGGARKGPRPAPDGEGGVHSLIDNIFQKAKEEGEKQGEDEEEPRAFYGRGQRLGHTTNPSPYIASTLRAERTVSVTVYRNGFQVDDDAFIPLESDEGRQFLEAMDKGFVPASLAAKYPNTDLSVNLRDCLQVDYTPPAYTAFQGQGHRLAATASASPGAPTANPSSSGGTGDANTSYDASSTLAVNDDEEKSFVVLLNTHGQRKQFAVNPARHTVEDLYTLAHTYQPEVARFVLVERGMPPRRMEAAMRPLTIAAAKLTRAVLAIQQL